MSTYQATYDAVRSKLTVCDIGDVVRDVIFQASLGDHLRSASQAFAEAATEYTRPSAVFRPALSIDGNQWCALYGENLQEGMAGFGDTPDAAMRAFDVAWFNQKAMAGK